jgi:glucitol operon activator protein
MEGLGLLFAAIAILWGAQIWAAHRQARNFTSEVNRLREFGRTAVGVSDQRRIKPRMYVALSAGEDMRVTRALQLRGATVFARPQPIPEFEGRDLHELATADGEDRRAVAAAMAARALLDQEDEPA